MANTNKLTKKDYFKMIMEVVEKAEVENKKELTDFLTHEVELLNKKAESRKSTDNAKTKEQNDLMEYIYNVLEQESRALTVTDLQNADGRLGELTNQKISAMLKKLVDSNRITKIVDKKKSYFKIG